MLDAALEGEQEEGENLFLTFLVDKDSFALAIDYVHEIVQLQPIVPVPQQQAHMKGVMNLRGDIIPVIDLKYRLRGVETQTTDRACIIVTDVGGEHAGMLVDEVSEVVNIKQEDLLPVTETGKGLDNCVCAIARDGECVRMVLDCDAVLGQGQHGMAETCLPLSH
ncbi:MAG: chemotaxis protein CheW [Ethanoligenens sp.]